MNKEPKSIWKKSWSGWRAFLLFAVSGFAVVLVFGIAAGVKSPATGLAGIIVGLALLVWLLVAAIRWATRPRNFKRFIFGLACLATLIALFYAEEDWRGWHAWNQFKHEWEAKGEHFNFASVIPAPVPDDQNFAMAPIWVEHIKATLGPKRAHQWYGDKFPDNGRTNFTERLQMNIDRNDDWPRAHSTTNGSGNWQTAKTSDLKIWQNYYRATAAGTNEFPVAAQPQSPAQDVLLALSKHDAAIEELRLASQLPYSRFPLDYDNENPAAILLPHLAAFKRCSQVLQLRSLAELQNSQPEKALADVNLSLQLTGKARDEFCLISHLVRIAMLQVTFQPIWEGLADHRWSDAQLVALDAELARLDFLADYKSSMRGEMAFQGGMIEYLRRHPEEIPGLSFNDEGNCNGPQPFPARIVWHMIPSGWFYQNRLRSAQLMVNSYIPLADVNQKTVSPTSVRHADEVLSAEAKTTTPYNLLERMMLPSLGACAKKFAYAQASVDLARTAIALERYRLAHGEYPESLDALAPQFIAKVPHDVIGGGPLKYRRNADGQFVLYSIGWNETDDGGVVGYRKSSNPRDESAGTPDISQGDWVWRYPAK